MYIIKQLKPQLIIKKIIIILFLSTPFLLKSQEISLVTDYKERVYLYEEVFQDFNNIKRGSDQEFISKNYPKIGIGLDYKFLTLFYAKEIKAFTKNGNENVVFKYGINLDHLRFSFRYDNQKFDSNFSIKNYATNIIFILKPNSVNYGSSFFYTADQAKSGHSFLFETNVNYIQEKSDYYSFIANAGIGSLACIKLGKYWRFTMKNSISPFSFLRSSFRLNSVLQLGKVKGNYFSMLNFYYHNLQTNSMKFSQYGWRFTVGLRFL